MNIYKALAVGGLALVIGGCRFYSFKGGALSPEVKTFTLYPINNRAPVVNPSFAPHLEEAFRDYLLRETSLTETPENGDLEFRISVIDYSVSPATVGADQARFNRFRVALKVHFVNHREPSYNLEKTFSAYADFESTENFAALEQALAEQLIRQLVEDIYNATINAW